MAPEIIGWSFIKNRKTGEPVGPLAPVYRDDWAYEVPDVGQRIWRYMDVWKFRDMLEKSSLYFRRADKLSDLGEGRLSIEGVRGTSLSDIAFKSAYNIAPQAHAVDIAAHETTRGCMFINCWNMDDTENSRMWNEYTTTSESIAVSTTFGRLIEVLSKEEVIISRVKYVDDSTPRSEFSHVMPFFYKDVSFAFENEVRVVRPVLDGEHVLVDDERDFGKFLAISVARLVDEVITHKNMPSTTVEAVQRLCQSYCPCAQVVPSPLEKYPIPSKAP